MLAVAKSSDPAGVTPEGDRLYFARKALGKTHDQMVELSGGAIQRANWIAVEKGRLRGSGLKAITGIAAAFGVSIAEASAYLNGSFGEPSLENARRFVGRVAPASIGDVFDQAFVNLSYSNPAKSSAYCLAALELKKPGGVAFHRPELLTQKHAENMIRLHVGEPAVE